MVEAMRRLECTRCSSAATRIMLVCRYFGVVLRSCAVASSAPLARCIHSVLSPQISVTLTAARDLAATRPNHYYSRALCAREKLRSEYFDALRDVDFLIEPTVPLMPARIDGYDSAPAAIAERGWSVLANTCNANVVGFPSISLPLGVSHGIPVGAMVTAAPWNDYALLQFAQACESEIGWNPSLAIP